MLVYLRGLPSHTSILPSYTREFDLRILVYYLRMPVYFGVYLRMPVYLVIYDSG